MYRIAVLLCVVSICGVGCASEGNSALQLFYAAAFALLVLYGAGCFRLAQVRWQLHRMLRAANSERPLGEFAKAWRDNPFLRGVFRDTSDTRELVTDRIEDFDLDWILSRMGPSRVLVEQIPPAFTALGIFFTFIGLIQGIADLDTTAGSEQLALGMSTLLQGVATAFTSSIIGIALSVPTLIISKVLHQLVRKAAVNLRDVIVVQSGRDSSPEGTLAKIANLSHQNLDTNREISAKMGTLGTDIKTALEPLLREIVGDELTSLNNSMREFTEGSSQAHSAALENVMEDFIAQFNESLGGQFEELGNTLEKTLEWHRATQQSLQSVIEDLESMKADQAEAMKVERELLEVRLAAEKRQGAQLETLSGKTDALLTQLDGVSTRLDSTAEKWTPLGESIDRGSRDLGESVASLETRLGTLETLVRDFDSNLNSSSDQLRNLAREIRSELEDGFSETFSSFDHSTAEVVDRLNASYVNLKSAVADLDDTLKRTARPTTRPTGPIGGPG